MNIFSCKQEITDPDPLPPPRQITFVQLSCSDTDSVTDSDTGTDVDSVDEETNGIKKKKRKVDGFEFKLPPGFLAPLPPLSDDVINETESEAPTNTDDFVTERVDDVHDMSELEKLTIPELITHLKSEFRSVCFEKVKEILIYREEKMRSDNEEVRKRVEELKEEVEVYKGMVSSGVRTENDFVGIGSVLQSLVKESGGGEVERVMEGKRVVEMERKSFAQKPFKEMRECGNHVLDKENEKKRDHKGLEEVDVFKGMGNMGVRAEEVCNGKRTEIGQVERTTEVKRVVEMGRKSCTPKLLEIRECGNRFLGKESQKKRNDKGLEEQADAKIRYKSLEELGKVKNVSFEKSYANDEKRSNVDGANMGSDKFVSKPNCVSDSYIRTPAEVAKSRTANKKVNMDGANVVIGFSSKLRVGQVASDNKLKSKQVVEMEGKKDTSKQQAASRERGEHVLDEDSRKKSRIHEGSDKHADVKTKKTTEEEFLKVRSVFLEISSNEKKERSNVDGANVVREPSLAKPNYTRDALRSPIRSPFGGDKRKIVNNGVESSMCHQCQRNDKGEVVRCTNCKSKRYCIPCLKWSFTPSPMVGFGKLDL